MPRRPIERLTLSIELYEGTVRVKSFYYEGETLAATTGDTVRIPAEAREWKRRLTDLLVLHADTRRAVRLWVDQLCLF